MGKLQFYPTPRKEVEDTIYSFGKGVTVAFLKLTGNFYSDTGCDITQRECIMLLQKMVALFPNNLFLEAPWNVCHVQDSELIKRRVLFSAEKVASLAEL